MAERYAVLGSSAYTRRLGEPSLTNYYGVSHLIEDNPTEHVSTGGNNWQEQSPDGLVTVTGGTYTSVSFATTSLPDRLGANLHAPDIATFSGGSISATSDTIDIGKGLNDTIQGDSDSVYEIPQSGTKVVLNGSAYDTLYFAADPNLPNSKGPTANPVTGSASAPKQSGNGIWTWTGSGNVTYVYTPTTGINVGTLTATSSTDSYVINNFNLITALIGNNGFDGIKLSSAVALKTGTGANPLKTSNTASPSLVSQKQVDNGTTVNGEEQTVTIYASAAQSTAQQVTLNASGDSGFLVDTGNSFQSLANGAVTLTIPAGEDHVTFSLLDTNTSQGAQTLSLNATLNSDQAVSGPLTLNFSGSSATPNPTISLADAHTGTGQVSVNATQLPGGNGSTAGSNGPAADTWTGADGSIYKFAPNAANIGQGLGTLTITGGNLAAGDQVTLANFNLATATSSGGSGYLGITLQGQYALQNTTSANPFTTTGGTLANATANSAGTSIPLMLCVPSGSAQARTINLTLSGGTASQYQIVSGGSAKNFSGNSAVITIPANATSVPITLNYIGTSKTAQSVSLSLTAPQGGAAIEANTLTATDYNSSGNGTGGSGTSNASNPLVTNDTITVTGSNGVIYGNGGQDIIEAGAQNNGGNTVFADTQIPIAAALTNTQTQAATTGAGSFIYTQDGNNNTLVGGTENDTIVTGNGNNLVIMGSGNSTYVGGVDVTGVNSNWSVGVSGTQITTSSSVQFAATAAPAAGYLGNSFTNGSGTVNAVGVGSDTIYGGAGKNTYVLSNGNNYLDAGSGNDTIDIGTGQNTIFAGSGSDVINGGGGVSYIDTESGNDHVYLNGGQNTIYGGTGNELIYSGNATNWASAIATENNLIEAGSGNDTIYGAGGNDTINGGTGKDYIYAGNGNTVIHGGSGIMSITGGSGADVISAGGGGIKGAPTVINAGSGATTINGGAGVDWITGGLGNNVLNAGDGGIAGAPTMVKAGSGATTINGGAGLDYITGGSGNDVINAGEGGTAASATQITAGSGSTTINGGAGVDYIAGGSGNDLLNAGDGGAAQGRTSIVGGKSGNDTMVSGQGFVDFFDGSGTSINTFQINAGGGNTQIYNTRAGDSLVFGPGLTIGNLAGIVNSYGSITMTFDDGTTVNFSSTNLTQATFGDGTIATFAQLLSAQFNVGNTVYSTTNAALPSATGSATDTLSLSGVADLVGQGNNVNDVIIANTGNDTLIAGTANNTLVGGGASEVYEVQSVSGTVTTINASTEADTLVFAAGTTLADLSISTATDAGGNLDVTIQNGQGGEVVVNGVLNSTANGGDGSNTLLDTLAFADGSTASLSQLLSQMTTGAVAATSATNVTLVGGMQNMALEAANITATGNNLDNVITAGGTNDTLIAGTGSDTLSGGGFAGTTYQVGTGSGNVSIIHSSATDSLALGSGITESDLTTTVASINGQTVTTVSNRQGGTVTIQGALVNLNFADGSTATIAQLLAPSYTKASTTYSQVSATAGNGITTLALTGNADITGTANGGNMTLVANVGNDTLVAGTASDTLVGGGISDDYVIAGGSQTTTITNSSMFDAISFGTGVVASDLGASESTVGGAEIITLTNSLGGTVNINVGQGAPVDAILFADGTFASLGAILAQNTTGASAATSAVDVTLPEGIQNMQLTGSTSVTATANELANVITANAGNDTLVAGAGNDTLVGSSASTSSTTYGFTSTDGDLVIQNSSTNDVLVFDGSLAESDMTTASTVVNGQTVVTLTTDQGQTITIAGGLNKVSFADGNTATIAELLASSYNGSSNATTYSNVGTTAGAGITTLALTGNANIVGAANSGNDTLISNSGNDTLVAGAGKDTLIGGAGDTTYSMAAGYGAATIEGAGAGDTIAFGTGVSASSLMFMETKAGDGSISLSIVNSQGNTITVSDYTPGLVDTVSLAGGQSESIQTVLAQSTTGVGAATSAVNVTLPEGIQNMTLTGTWNLVAQANDEANVITSNSGNDTLVAGTGSDTLVGGSGATTYVVSAGDGNITINSSSAHDTLLFDGSMSEAALTATSATVNGQTIVTITNAEGGTIAINGGALNQLGFADGNITLAQLLSGSYAVGATEYAQTNATLAANLQNLTGVGSGNLYLTGNSQAHNVITANGGNDTLFSGSGIDTLIGGTGNDMFVVTNAATVIQEAPNSGSNLEKTSVSVTLAANVQNLTGFAGGNLTLIGNNLNNTITANSGNDLLVAGSGADTLVGSTGADVLEGGSGNDVMNDSSGANAMLAGSGNDSLNAGSGAAFLAGGAGNDAITLGSGKAVVAFNSGNGPAAIYAGSAGSASDVLSLGGGIAYANLSFSKSGNNLILNTGGNNAITFTNWYGGSANQNFVTLQVIEQAAATYSATSSNPLYNSEVETFSFTSLVADFNSALAANPGLTNWRLSNTLLNDHLASSNTAALGGDLAYYDGLNGNLTGLNLATAASTLQGSGFGSTAQTVDAWSGISGGANKLH